MNKYLLDIEYARKREWQKSLRYRFLRRTHEVLSAIERFGRKPVEGIVDLGTADSRMLDIIHQKHPHARCVGIEYTQELVDYGKAKFPHLEIVQGNIRSISFPDNSFDVAIATAVIEHVPDPTKVMKEAKRVLKPSGIFVLTSPDPFWEHMATMIGHLDDKTHCEVMSLKKLVKLFRGVGFEICEKKKFMLSPIGMPCEYLVENFIRKIGLNFLFANQLVIGKKNNLPE